MGRTQTIRYIDALETCCQMLANNPTLGRPCEDIQLGLYRKEQGKHVIFFRREPEAINVSRILHERMLPGRHVFEYEAKISMEQ